MFGIKFGFGHANVTFERKNGRDRIIEQISN